MSVTIQRNAQTLGIFPRQQYCLSDDAEITCGDLHGNSIKPISILQQYGICSVSQEDFFTLCAIYEELSAGKLDGYTYRAKALIKLLDEVIERLSVNKPNVLIRLIGDVLNDRGNNDYITLKILRKLTQPKRVEILLSNHDAEFIYNYEQQKDFNESTHLSKKDQAESASGLQQLINQGIIKRADVDEIVDTAYLPFLKAFSYSYDKISGEITIYHHAPIVDDQESAPKVIREIMLDFIEKLATELGVFYQDADASQVMETIERINTRIQEKAQHRQLHECMKVGTQLHRIMWDRVEDTAKQCENERLKDKKFPYTIKSVHGHDGSPRDSSDYILNLNDEFGRPALGGGVNWRSPVEYYVAVSGSCEYLPEAQLSGSFVTERTLLGVAAAVNIQPDAVLSEISLAKKQECLQKLSKLKEEIKKLLEKLFKLFSKSKELKNVRLEKSKSYLKPELANVATYKALKDIETDILLISELSDNNDNDLEEKYLQIKTRVDAISREVNAEEKMSTLYVEMEEQLSLKAEIDSYSDNDSTVSSNKELINSLLDKKRQQIITTEKFLVKQELDNLKKTFIPKVINTKIKPESPALIYPSELPQQTVQVLPQKNMPLQQTDFDVELKALYHRAFDSLIGNGEYIVGIPDNIKTLLGKKLLEEKRLSINEENDLRNYFNKKEDKKDIKAAKELIYAKASEWFLGLKGSERRNALSLAFPDSKDYQRVVMLIVKSALGLFSREDQQLLESSPLYADEEGLNKFYRLVVAACYQDRIPGKKLPKELLGNVDAKGLPLVLTDKSLWIPAAKNILGISLTALIYPSELPQQTVQVLPQKNMPLQQTDFDVELKALYHRAFDSLIGSGEYIVGIPDNIKTLLGKKLLEEKRLSINEENDLRNYFNTKEDKKDIQEAKELIYAKVSELFLGTKVSDIRNALLTAFPDPIEYQVVKFLLAKSALGVCTQEDQQLLASNLLYANQDALNEFYRLVVAACYQDRIPGKKLLSNVDAKGLPVVLTDKSLWIHAAKQILGISLTAPQNTMQEPPSTNNSPLQRNTLFGARQPFSAADQSIPSSSSYHYKR